MACSEGCLGGVKSGAGLGCVINPEVARVDELRFDLSDTPGTYAIVGGGPAGLTSAQVLAGRGHTVDLFEVDQLGGQFRFAPLPPGKDSLQKGIEYYVGDLEDRDPVEIRFEDVSPAELSAYDGVFVATGSQPAEPPIEGLDTLDYHGPEIMLAENLPTNSRVMVIGGGYVGLETADALAVADNEVIVVEILPEFGGDMLGLEKGPIMQRLGEREDVTLHSETALELVSPDRVVAERGGEKLVFEDIDEFVLATGVRSYNPFEGLEAELDVPMYVVGDAREPGDAADAIEDAFEQARSV
jgi:NADPH-dependent 2,4-dienoyl-CoA reductase/sulfur reductase-like enzyme